MMKAPFTRLLSIGALGCTLTLTACMNPYFGPNGSYAGPVFTGGQSHTVRSLGLRGRGHPLGYRAQSGRPRYSTLYTPRYYRTSYSPAMLNASRGGIVPYRSSYAYSPALGFGSPFRQRSALGFGSPFGMGFGGGLGGFGW